MKQGAPLEKGKRKAGGNKKTNPSKVALPAQREFSAPSAPLSLGHIDREKLLRGLERFSLEVTSEQLDRLDYFCGMVKDWNTRMNLTNITDPAGMAEKHILDSLLLLWAFPISPGTRMLDVGTGAGFPAVPLLIVCPEARGVLLDSLNKRLVFLQEVQKTLSLPFETLHARAEEAAHQKALRESFDLVTARAVASLEVLVELCLPFVRLGGYFTAMKGASGEQELQEARSIAEKLGGQVEKVLSYSLNEDGENARTIIIFRKIRQTPLDFPRSFAKIQGKREGK